MSFDILREFDTLYAPKPAQQQSTQSSSSGFSFFDSLANTHSTTQKQPAAAAAASFGDGFLPPQRPSSVQLSTQSAYRGIPQPMTRNKSNPLSNGVGVGSSFNDLVSLLDTPSYVSSPVQNIKQPSTSRPSSYHGTNRASSGGKDPFAALAAASGLKSSNIPTPAKSQSTFSWGRKSPQLPQQEEEVDDDFGDFAEASSSPMKTPTLPSRALQDSGKGFRRSLSISTHAPNNSAFTFAIPPTSRHPSKDDLHSNSNTLLSLIDTNDFQQSNTVANDDDFGDDFGDFIASPTKSQFPTTTSTGASITKPTPTTITIPPTPTTPKPFGIIPLPTPAATPAAASTSRKPTTFTPATLPPLSTILTPFSTIFSQPATHLFSKLTKHPYPLRQRILSHPKTHDFLLGICETARVAGRIIAGRKSRPKRTKLTSVGSGGGGNSDHETQKEDREIAELVRIWKEECAGRLKAAMVTPRSSSSLNSSLSHGYSASDPTALSSNHPNISRVPELEVDLRADKASRGGASILDEEDRPCVLCGLQQNELVAKLHEHEFGAGGRWWVRGWGHRGCLRWWEEWERQLGGSAGGGKKAGAGVGGRLVGK